MEVFEMGIDQLIRVLRIPGKNNGTVIRRMATIKEYGIAIRILARLRHAGGAKYRRTRIAELELFAPPTRPNQTTLLIPGPPSTSKWHEISKRFRDTSNGVLKGLPESGLFFKRICSMEVFEMGIDQMIPAPRIPRNNNGTVDRRMATIKEYGIAIRILARLRHAGGVEYRLTHIAELELFAPPTQPNQTTLLIPGPPSTSRWPEIWKRSRNTSNGVLRGLTGIGTIFQKDLQHGSF
jgi:hypothetical protein